MNEAGAHRLASAELEMSRIDAVHAQHTYSCFVPRLRHANAGAENMANAMNLLLLLNFTDDTSDKDLLAHQGSSCTSFEEGSSAG